MLREALGKRWAMSIKMRIQPFLRGGTAIWQGFAPAPASRTPSFRMGNRNALLSRVCR